MAPSRDEPLSEVDRVRHTLNRFSLGRTQDLEQEVLRMGVMPWFDAQIEAGRGGRTGSWVGGAAADSDPEGPRLRAGLKGLESIHLTNREIIDRYVEIQLPDGRRDKSKIRIPLGELRQRILVHAVHGLELREAAADFFRNHFSISVEKGRVRFYATTFERDVIHRRVFGTFLEMLTASTQHPAMLVYLDNVISRRPSTKAELKKIEMRVRLEKQSKEEGLTASNIAAQRGLNENFARELMELHTLGVDNGYQQADVENVARALTGWTISTEGDEPIEFAFKDDHHEKGNKKLLHHVIKDDWKSPVSEGEEVLSILAKERGTADHIAFKLCRHFVHDQPDAELVERISSAFRKSAGDLPTVYRAIVSDPAFFDPRNYRAKFKRPFELVVSALRAVDATIEHTRGLEKALRGMDEDLLACKDPTGYYDQAEAWLDPGAMAVRWSFALELGTGKLEGVHIPDRFFAALPPKEPEAWIGILERRLLPSGLEVRVKRELEAMLRARSQEQGELTPSATREFGGLMTGIIIGSAEFQKQ